MTTSLKSAQQAHARITFGAIHGPTSPTQPSNAPSGVAVRNHRLPQRAAPTEWEGPRMRGRQGRLRGACVPNGTAVAPSVANAHDEGPNLARRECDDCTSPRNQGNHETSYPSTQDLMPPWRATSSPSQTSLTKNQVSWPSKPGAVSLTSGQSVGNFTARGRPRRGVFLHPTAN